MKSRRVNLSVTAITILLLLNGCVRDRNAIEETPLLQGARRTSNGLLPIVRLEGAPYQMGYQHGSLMRREIHEQWNQIMSFALGHIPIPIFNRLYVYWRLGRAYGRMESFISSDYKEEMKGLADGAQISLHKVKWAHAIPDLYPTLCANGVYFGKATVAGRLYHLRNLDWSRELGVQERPCVFVVHPAGKNAYVHFGYAGFIGVLSGINEKGIAVGQIGCDTIDSTLRGVPMPLLLRRVLENSSDLDEAERVVEKSTRTYGYNYVFSDAIRKHAVALETTAHHFASFMPNDSVEKESGYGFPLEDMLIRSDTAFDPTIRSLQTASGGNPKTPAVEFPVGKAYETRYKKQCLLAVDLYGSLDHEKLLHVAHEIAPGSNIQSVLFGYPDVWVANAEGEKRAVDSTYHHFNIEDLLKGR